MGLDLHQEDSIVPKHLLIGAMALFLSVFVSPGAHAQSSDGAGSVQVPDEITSDGARDLVAGMTDEQVRKLLLERLDAVAEQQAEARTEDPNSLSQVFYHATTGAVASILSAFKAVPNLLRFQAEAVSNFFAAFGTVGILKFLGFLAIIVAAGLAAEMLVMRFTKKWFTLGPQDQRPETLRETVVTLFKRLCRDLLGVFVFIAVGRTVAFSILPENMQPFAQIVLFNLVVIPRIAIAVSRFLLAPNRPNFRVVNADDQTAKFLNRHIVGFSMLIGFTLAILGFNKLNGVPLQEMQLEFWLNLALHLYIIWIAWTARDGLVQMMRGPDSGVSAVEAKVSMAYPYFAIAVSIGMWWLVETMVSMGKTEILSSAPHFKTMALLLLAPALDTLVRGVVRHIMPPMLGVGTVAKRAHHATEVSYVRIGRVIVFGLVVIQIARFWGLTIGQFATNAVGGAYAENIIKALMTILVGYLLWEIVSVVVNRKLAAEMTASGDVPNEEDIGDGGGDGKSRLSTVLPLILLTARATIVILFTLAALSALGIDTTPLLAGAGVLGLAIGFGAQKLVTDVVSGVFFLVDDAFRVGEYVDVGDVKGTIEKISVRSMQLRHHLGLVHTVPYGDISKVTNFSRDWVITKLKFTVPFETDPDKVRKIFKNIGVEVQEMDEFKDDMLQPFKSQGVYDFDDVGMIVRGKFMAKPGTQFMMRKEIYNRVKAAFNEAGIEFARREVRVAMPGMDDGDTLTGPEKAKIAATAAAQMKKKEAE
jgi:small-conductance mechanosensitive channel